MRALISRTKLRTLSITILALGLFLTGCGYDPREPVYDTKGNPKGFPQRATELLDGIESGRLKTYEAITDAFADLYMAHPTLLGNEAWGDVIQRLGNRLIYRADRLVSDGLLQFAQAAEFYRVAAEVMRKDPLVLDKARQFGTWKAFQSDSTFDAHRLQGSFDPDYRLDLLTRFALQDSLHLAFARNYLAAELFPESADDVSRAMAGRPLADRALLAAAGAYPADSLTGLASFDGHTVELVSWRLAPLADSLYRFEAYFRTAHRLSRKLGVSVRVETPDPNLPDDKQPVFPYDCDPLCGSDGWPTGQVAVATRTISFSWPISAIRIGLFEMTPNGSVYLPPDNGTGQRVRFPYASGN